MNSSTEQLVIKRVPAVYIHSSRQVASLIAKCTGTHQKLFKTKDLANLCIKRTDGDPFFVVRFMEFLQHQCLLKYCPDMCMWSWSVDQIQAETNASQNVVEILKERIRRLKHTVQSVLRLAAVQGFRFDKAVIKAVALEEAPMPDPRRRKIGMQVDDALRVAESQGLIESNTDGSLRFSHDSICECLYSMIPRGKKLATVHLTVARVMRSRSKCGVYSIADQLYRAKQVISSDADRLNCAQCSLQASKLALTQSCNQHCMLRTTSPVPTARIICQIYHQCMRNNKDAPPLGQRRSSRHIIVVCRAV